MGVGGGGDVLVWGRDWCELGNPSNTQVTARNSGSDVEGQWDSEGEAF